MKAEERLREEDLKNGVQILCDKICKEETEQEAKFGISTKQQY